MDLKAKSYLPIAQSQPRHFDIAGEPWQVWVKGTKLMKRIQSNIYSAVQGVDSKQYWRTKKDIDPSGVQLVDWAAIGRAMRTIPRNRRVFVMKHVSGMCGVGKFMKRWKEWPTDSCPRCSEPEDSFHVWCCKGSGTEELWLKAIAELESLLSKLDTDPTLKFLIVTYLKGWWTGDGIHYEAPRKCQEIVQAQQMVGWRRFFEGWLVQAWSAQQQQYYDILKSPRMG